MNITGREDAYETPGKVERKHARVACWKECGLGV